MNWSFIPIFLLLIIILSERRKEKQFQIIKNIKSKSKKGRTLMTELINSYIDKECLIYTMNSQITGVVKSVNEGWISVETASNIEIINLDYVVRIREYPKNKNGKKKSLVLD